MSISPRSWRSQTVFLTFTATLNLIMLVMLFIPGIAIVYGYDSRSLFVQSLSDVGTTIDDEQASPKVNDSAARPDIYYIIPDGIRAMHG